MDRGTRRHHAARIRIRKNRRLWEEHGHWLWEPGARSKLWWPMHKLTMSSYPKWWDVEYHTRPARIRSNGLLHLIERGVDSDVLHFPNYRKPHLYYW